MAYLGKLSPTVGNGLGGLPNRKGTTTNSNRLKPLDVLITSDAGSLYESQIPLGAKELDKNEPKNQLVLDALPSFIKVKTKDIPAMPTSPSSLDYLQDIGVAPNGKTVFIRRYYNHSSSFIMHKHDGYRANLTLSKGVPAGGLVKLSGDSRYVGVTTADNSGSCYRITYPENSNSADFTLLGSSNYNTSTSYAMTTLEVATNLVVVCKSSSHTNGGGAGLQIFQGYSGTNPFTLTGFNLDRGYFNSKVSSTRTYVAAAEVSALKIGKLNHASRVCTALTLPDLSSLYYRSNPQAFDFYDPDNLCLATATITASGRIALLKLNPNNLTATAVNVSGSIAGKPMAVKFSPDGKFFAVVTDASPYLHVFRKNSSGVYSKIDPFNGATYNPSVTDIIGAIVWTPNNVLMYVESFSGDTYIFNNLDPDKPRPFPGEYISSAIKNALTEYINLKFDVSQSVIAVE